MLLALLTIAFCATAAFATQCASTACEDGIDNVLHFNDCGSASADVKFLKVLALTYKQDGTTPYCKCNTKSGKMEGLVNFPGVINIKDIEMNIDHAVNLGKGTTTLRLTFTKELIVGKVCVNGTSNNPLVPDKFCLQDFCTLLSADNICGILNGKTGHVSLNSGYRINAPSVNALLGVLLDGLYDVGATLQENSTGEILGCLIAPDAYLHAGQVFN